jgi:hypothetical protein
LLPIGPRWRELFETFEHTAFRLEVRDTYRSPSEVDLVRRFVEDGSIVPAWLDDWLADRRADAEAGKTFRRVRVVSVPPTDYARFGLAYSAFNNDAGEDIRYLARPDADELGLPTFDYWMFDSRTVAKMHFDDEDKFLGFEMLEDPAAVVDLNHARDVAWHHAVTRDDFAAKHSDQR